MGFNRRKGNRKFSQEIKLNRQSNLDNWSYKVHVWKSATVHWGHACRKMKNSKHLQWGWVCHHWGAAPVVGTLARVSTSHDALPNRPLMIQAAEYSLDFSGDIYCFTPLHVVSMPRMLLMVILLLCLGVTCLAWS